MLKENNVVKQTNNFVKKLVDEIATNYGFGLAIAKACVDKGWEDGHAAGYSEVRTQAEIAASSSGSTT